MSELKRWTDEGAPQEIEHLLRAAESEQPSAASLASALTSLGVAAVVTSGATVAGAAGAAGAAGSAALTAAAIPGKLSVLALTVSLAKWIALGSIVGGGAMAVYVAASEAPGPSRQVVAPQASTRPTVPSDRRQHATPASAAASLASSGPTAGTNEASNLGAKQSAPPAPRTSSRAGASLPRDPDGADEQATEAVPVETLAEEIAEIDRARSLVAAGRPAAAIAALDDYERRFPRHHFAPEALYLRMEASLGAGRTHEARLLAQRLLAAYPTSPQSEKARQLLDRKIE